MSKMNNMEIWDKVSKTDPDQTKEVTYGRKFTAIDAHTQVMAATNLFGPVGACWGYETEYSTLTVERGDTLVFCDLLFWWALEGTEWEGIPGPKQRCEYGPIRGCAIVAGVDAKGKKKTPDTDAPKKAMTDALTKALSHLGFNADVFLGMFDDNKYVTGLRKEKQAENEQDQKAYMESRAAFIADVQAALGTNLDDVDEVIKKHDKWISDLAPGIHAELMSWVQRQKAKQEAANKGDK